MLLDADRLAHAHYGGGGVGAGDRMKNDIFVHFHSNLEILVRFHKPHDTTWIRHWGGGGDDDKVL